MVNMKNIPQEVKDECTVRGNRYFDSVEYKAVRVLRQICEALPKEAELIGSNIVNAYRRYEDKSPDSLIPFTSEDYIKFLYKGYIVYLEFGCYWIFEGPMLWAYPVKDGIYHTDRYPVNRPCNKKDNVANLIDLLTHPEKIYESMDRISRISKRGINAEYIDRVRKPEIRFYCM